MHNLDSAKTLFQLQTELVDTKVDVAVSKAINQVVEQIVNLRHEMHEFKTEIGSRLSSVETALGFRNQLRTEMRNRMYDYLFKVGWLLLGSIITALGFIVL